MEKMNNIIFVIPTYNEKENIGKLIIRIFEIVPEAKIMIVDDSSPDGTEEAVKSLQFKYPDLFLFSRKVKDGLGNAYKAGFKKIMAEFPECETIFMMDADLSHNPEDIPALLEGSKNFDLVIGSAHLQPDGMSEYPWPRVLLSRWANFYCRHILGYPLRDWTNAFMAISVTVLKKINLEELEAKEFAFVFGLRHQLLKKGASWKEVPSIIRLRNAGQSKMAFSTIWEGIVVPWRLRFEKIETVRQIIKFLISGLTVALVNFSLLYFFTEFIKIWYLFSVVLSFILAFAVSFTLQKSWTFKDRSLEKVNFQLLSYLGVTLMNLLINVAVVYLLVEKLGFWYMLAQLVANGLIAVESFIIYKFMIFKKSSAK